MWSSIRFQTGVTFEEKLYIITEGYLNLITIICPSCDNIYSTNIVIKDCFSGGAILKTLKKIGTILVFETLQSEIFLQELHKQI